MPIIPLFLISSLLHAWVGWRIAPALDGFVAFEHGGALFWVLLVASALLMPMGLMARRFYSRAVTVALTWLGLIFMGLFSSLFVLTLLRDGVLPVTFAATPASPENPKAAAKAGATLPLVIGQPVTVVAQFKARIQGVVLPAQAVVRNPSNEPIVWIKSGAERFIPQPVQVQPLDANTVVVTQGLSADNRVVVQGAPLIAQIR